MRGGLVIGLDVGTGSTKAIVLDPDVGVLGRGSAEYATSTPGAGLAEQDPADWWSASVVAIRQAIRTVRAQDVSAIAVSGQGAALVLVDRLGVPVRPALIHLDQRAEVEARELADSAVGSAVRASGGNEVGAWNTAAKLTWIRRHEPDAFARTAGITSAAGFVLAGLAGFPAQNVSDAGISDLFQVNERQWSRSVLDALHLSSSLLPELFQPTAEMGPLAVDAAEELGLSRNVRVVAGGEDTSSAALAVGVLAGGDAYLSLGTAGVVGVAVGREASREPRLLTFPHVRPEWNLLSGSMTSAGSALRWLSTVAGRSVESLLAMAEQVPPGADGVMFLPYLAGELHPIADPSARAVFAGMSLATGPAELTRAVLEGSAAAVAHNLAVATEAGASPVRLAATGRPTASRAWMQAIADAAGVPVEVHDSEGAPLGDALLAAASGDGDLPDLVAAHRHTRTRHHPRPDEHAASVERRARLAALYAATRRQL